MPSRFPTRTVWMGPPVTRPARRIVSLVPSLTEAVFQIGAADRLVARTANYIPLVSGSLGTRGSFPFIFLGTLVFALPVWCLYLPFILKLKDAEGRRLWVILSTGTLIGPVATGLAAVVFLLNTVGLQRIIYGTGDLRAIGALMGFAFFVGCLTSAFYVLALRRMLRRPR
ncbi:MAG: hypothetical protein HS123_09095 [Solibacteraceae bacterium]|nr:hypothetical protein [Solibacteraceae bacterium]